MFYYANHMILNRLCLCHVRESNNRLPGVVDVKTQNRFALLATDNDDEGDD